MFHISTGEKISTCPRCLIQVIHLCLGVTSNSPSIKKCCPECDKGHSKVVESCLRETDISLARQNYQPKQPKVTTQRTVWLVPLWGLVTWEKALSTGCGSVHGHCYFLAGGFSLSRSLPGLCISKSALGVTAGNTRCPQAGLPTAFPEWGEPEDSQGMWAS